MFSHQEAESRKKSSNRGEIFVCGTPIGNLKDVTLRVLDYLDDADIIVCEDTRRSLKFLNYYRKAEKQLISLHRHSHPGKLEKIKKLLEQGYKIALIADAGMPGISDPGSQLVRMAKENQYSVKVIPGPSSVTAALSISGYPADSFLFWGFLSSSGKKRARELSVIAGYDKTIVIFETPHRIKKTLNALKEYVGDRETVLARELTKKHEEILRAPPAELVDSCEQKSPRGEYVLVLSPLETKETGASKAQPAQEVDLKEDIRKLLAAGIPPAQAAKSVSLLRNVDRNKVYQLLIDMKNQD